MAGKRHSEHRAGVPRCFLCSARLWDGEGRDLSWGERVRPFAFACGSCGLLVDDPAADAPSRAQLGRALKPGPVVCEPDAPYGFDAYTLRSAATLHGLWAEPMGEAQAEALRQPHSPLPGAAHLRPLTDGPSAPISLAILCRAAEREAALGLAEAARVWCDDVLILLDGEGAGEDGPGLRLRYRPLAGHFAAQRNAAQDLTRHDWVLQLDADETLEEGVAEALPYLVGAVGPDVISIGLRRANRVDGVLSDLFPDTQYRLNRRSVRYENPVHERPARPWQQSLLFLGGGIRHHLGRAHVEARSRRYEAMNPGGGRLFEESELLRPYEA
ncbi:hypothetical protein [Aureimonas sp. D3]|uniref:hypothetical protein n=1 Tax=Aureimonas sp. D3 TaxID=1638164 RepID=UPI000780DEDE|nr:hypothetical protein [Aureimonas sp. D3]